MALPASSDTEPIEFDDDELQTLSASSFWAEKQKRKIIGNDTEH